MGLAALGGALGYGLDWGVSHAKVSAAWQLGIATAVGLGGTLALAKWGDERLAAGLAGATVANGVTRLREIIALSQLDKKKSASTGPALPTETAAVYRQPYLRDAAAVYRQNPRLTGAQTMYPGPFGTSFKEAGAVVRRGNPSAYIPGPVRFFGPRSWVYNTESGRTVRVRSAHSSG